MTDLRTGEAGAGPIAQASRGLASRLAAQVAERRGRRQNNYSSDTLAG